MERDREITKLVNVLHRIGRATSYAAWANAAPDASAFCVKQYNRVLARLSELEPAVAQLFTPLPEAAAPEVVRLAAHELAAYFEDESASRGRHRAWQCGGRRVWVGVAPFGGHCW
ncbi:MAG TPA: hypothetical protein VNN73_23700 [Blastocatellia bacterium]|nr:hypothetical protein [Blastocatellia bacterium]